MWELLEAWTVERDGSIPIPTIRPQWFHKLPSKELPPKRAWSSCRLINPSVSSLLNGTWRYVFTYLLVYFQIDEHLSLWYHTIGLYSILSYTIISYHIISYHITLYYIILCQRISYYIRIYYIVLLCMILSYLKLYHMMLRYLMLS